MIKTVMAIIADAVHF